MNVNACPICGLEYLVHCWHEPQEEVATVNMPTTEAIKLCEAWLKELNERVEKHREQLNKYTGALTR
jgi:hypothetical protein